ncbi:MAG TPA: ABC transporter ATP-binding protein [Actinomycetota bacterium]|nr:ABC transporter ATP-binding protein [Actinomycetota bacterium]
MSALLEVSDLRTVIDVRAGQVHAVDGVTFSVDAGETVGLVGESGCGKTMTGLSILRLLPPGGRIAGGEIRFNGKEISRSSDEAMQRVRGGDIGMVFQDPMTSLNPTLTIGYQIAESVRLHRGKSKEEGLRRAAELLKLVGMPRPEERLGDYPHQLSGGLRQRVMIAMALACDPKLLIADEPTTALDVTIQAQILGLLDDLKERLGLAMLLITHDLGVIAGRADRVIVMYAGRIVESCGTAELFAHTRHPYAEALLASIPKLDLGAGQRLKSIPGLPPDLVEPPRACRFAPRCPYAAERCRAEDPPLEAPRDPVVPDEAWAAPDPAAEAPPDGDVPVPAPTAAPGHDGHRPVPHSFACFFPRPDKGPAVAVSGERNGDAAAVAQADDLILELRAVSKEFPVRSGMILQRTVGSLYAVTEVSLGVRRGETFGLVGESGCGKTTLGKMIVDLETPTAGSVWFNGTDLATLSAGELRRTRRDLQMMFQDPYASLDPRMRVETIVGEPLVVQHEGDRAARHKRVAELLADVGLDPRAAERHPHEFSGGQRQRIGLARALALNPKLIVADEPVSALDVSIRSQILNLMQALQDTYGLTYIVISHDLSVVRFLADRIGVMYLGRLVEVGTGDDIYLRPAHPYTAALLEAIPVPDPGLERSKTGETIKGELPSPVHPPSGCRFRTRCPIVQPICAEEVPPLASRGGEHLAACHFPLA